MTIISCRVELFTFFLATQSCWREQGNLASSFSLVPLPVFSLASYVTNGPDWLEMMKNRHIMVNLSAVERRKVWQKKKSRENNVEISWVSPESCHREPITTRESVLIYVSRCGHNSDSFALLEGRTLAVTHCKTPIWQLLETPDRTRDKTMIFLKNQSLFLFDVGIYWKLMNLYQVSTLYCKLQSVTQRVWTESSIILLKLNVNFVWNLSFIQILFYSKWYLLRPLWLGFSQWSFLQESRVFSADQDPRLHCQIGLFYSTLEKMVFLR